jgi:glucose-1-phosphate thymidylyltransferase
MRSEAPGITLTDAQHRAADAGHKAMMPIAGRPFLDFVLSAAADAGLDRIAIVVAPDHRALRHYYDVASPPSRIRVDFVVQAEPRGTADAVLAAQQWIGDDAFLVMNGDNLYPVRDLSALSGLGEPGLLGFDPEDLVRSGNVPADRVRAFALVEQDAEGHLTRIVEKPSSEDVTRLGPAARVSMNCWRFDSRIFEACRTVAPSSRGELELPAAVALALNEGGVRFRVLSATGPVLDLSRRADAADLSHRLAGTEPRP